MRRHAPVLLLALALLATTVAFACAGPRAAGGAALAGRAHPDVGPVDGTTDCGDCHAQATPAIHQEWDASPHGVGMVKCLVCHGSRDALTTAPPPSRCQGCHAAEVASAPSGTACFACHAPHTLAAAAKPNPHQR
jgi:hypothetical protein